MPGPDGRKSVRPGFVNGQFATRNGIVKTITVHRLSLQFDAGQITHGTRTEQARQAVELINLTLQREPFGLGAQLIVHPDEIEVESRQIDPSA